MSTSGRWFALGAVVPGKIPRPRLSGRGGNTVATPISRTQMPRQMMKRADRSSPVIDKEMRKFQLVNNSMGVTLSHSSFLLRPQVRILWIRQVRIFFPRVPLVLVDSWEPHVLVVIILKTLGLWNSISSLFDLLIFWYIITRSYYS